MPNQAPELISKTPSGNDTEAKPTLQPDPHDLGSKASAMHRAGVEPIDEKPKDLTKDIVEWTQDQPFFSEDSQERLSTLAKLNGISLATLITSVHSLVAPTSPATPHPDVVKAGDKPMVPPERRLEYLNKAAELIKEVAQLEAKTEKERTRALARIADIVGLATVITHTFADGNGRTSRTLALLLKADPSDYLQDLPAVSANRTNKTGGHTINSYIPRVHTGLREPLGNTPEEEWAAVQVAAGLEFDLTDQGQAQYNKATYLTYVSPLVRTN